MAQTGFTPIALYYSSTTTNVPLAGNLAAGELALNTADGKLFYKDNVGAVQVIGWKTVPVTAGGTGVTSSTGTGSVVLSASPTLTGNVGVNVAPTTALDVAGTIRARSGGGGVTFAPGLTFTYDGTAGFIQSKDGSSSTVPLVVEASEFNFTTQLGGMVAGNILDIAQTGIVVRYPTLFGYGSNTGSSVTQITSKSTPVTLNFPTGQVTMSNAALAAGATVNFELVNPFAGPTTAALVNLAGGFSNFNTYDVTVDTTAFPGIVYIRVKNISAGSLSEALILNVVLIKGSTS